MGLSSHIFIPTLIKLAYESPMWLTGEKQRYRLKWIFIKFYLWAVLIALLPNANTHLYNLIDILFFMKQFPVCYQLTQNYSKYHQNGSETHLSITRTGLCRLMRIESGNKLWPLHEPPNNWKFDQYGFFFKYLLIPFTELALVGSNHNWRVVLSSTQDSHMISLFLLLV